MKNFENLLNWATSNSNKLFLHSCLLVHIFYLFIFYRIHMQQLLTLDILSTLFYLCLLFFSKMREPAVVASYFEIIIFASLCELVLGPRFGFFMYVIGMLSVIFYLAPSFKNKRFLLQIFGIIIIIIVEVLNHFKVRSYHGLDIIGEPYIFCFFIFNLLITMIFVTFIAILYSIDLEKMKQELDFNMKHDFLTSLNNRRGLDIEVQSIIDNKQPYVVAIFDIDDFKKINDSYAHEAGDLVLATFAESLNHSVFDNIITARWGGEEFVIVYPNVTIEQAYKATEDLLNRVRNSTINFYNKQLTYTVTCGLVESVQGIDFHNTVKKADECLYYGKKHGKNQIVRKEQLG